MKQVLLLAAAAAVLLFPALDASAGHTGGHRTGPLGSVPPHVGGKQVGHQGARRVGGREIQLGATTSTAGGPNSRDDLTYGNGDQLDPNTGQGGPVMHSSKIYAIYWRPAGYSQGSGTHYQDTINTYFTDVAADSGDLTNVYSVLQQYYDLTGNTAYSASFGGFAVDTDAFPTDGCTLNQYDGFTIQNTTNCLDDSQLQTEIQSFADTKGWDHGPNVQIFLFTPKNVASCIADSTNSTFEQDCSYSDYCAYHSAFFSGGSSDSDPADEYIYANMPWPNQQIFTGTATYSSDCASGDYPNGDNTGAADDTNAADEVLSVTSHEHNEAWSDPLGTGWWVDNANSAYAGSEDGDLCAWYFPTRAKIASSPAIGSGSAYDQVINGHHYFVQGEWSNRSATGTANSGCVWNYAYASETTAAGISGTVTVGHTLTGDAGSWTGSPTSYKFEWLRCDDSGANCKSVKSITSSESTATYPLVAADDKHTMRLRVTGSNALGAGAASLSVPTSVVDGEPVSTVDPMITGTVTVGHTLTDDLGTWSPAATSYKIAWLRCDNAGNNCKSVKAATVNVPVTASPTYSLTKADDKMTIRFQVTATNAAGVSDTFTSSQTAAVNGEPAGGSPSITGTATVGQVLTGHLGSWTNAPTSYTYTWSRCPLGGGACRVIVKKAVTTTTAPTYTLVAADDRAMITFSVIASNASGVSDQAGDTAGPVNGQPTGGTASLSGSATVGQMLTASTSGWSPAATKYKYEWLHCDGGGANCTVFRTVSVTTASTTYRLAASDHGKTIRVRVTAMNLAGASDTTTSSATAAVA